MLRVLSWLLFPYAMLLFRWRRLSKPARIVGLLWTIIIIVAAIGARSGDPAGKPKAEPAAGADYDVKLIFPAERYPETADHIKDAIAQGEPAICTIERDQAEAHREASLAGIPTKQGFDRDEWPMAMCAEGGAGADIRYVTPNDNRGAGSWVGNELDGYADGTRVLIVIDGGSDTGAVSVKRDNADNVNVSKDDGAANIVPDAAADEPTVKTSEGTESSASASKSAIGAEVTDKSAVAGSTAKSTKPVAEPSNAPNQTAAEPVQSSKMPAASQAPAADVEQSAPDVYYRNCTAVREAGAAPLHAGDPGYSYKLDRDRDGVACE